jgi:hypothetical protein
MFQLTPEEAGVVSKGSVGFMWTFAQSAKAVSPPGTRELAAAMVRLCSRPKPGALLLVLEPLEHLFGARVEAVVDELAIPWRVAGAAEVLLRRVIEWNRHAQRYVAGRCSVAQFLHRRVLRRVPESAERRFIWKTNQRRPRANGPVAFHDLLGLHHIKHFAAVFGDRCTCVRHVGHELFHVMDDDLSDQIRCHRCYVSSQEELVLWEGSPKGIVILNVLIAFQRRLTAFDKKWTKGAVARSL